MISPGHRVIKKYMEKHALFQIRSKVWIQDARGEVIFGLGRLKILKTVQDLGSLHAAAKKLGMSYRALWGKIKATEDRIGFPLLIRNIGGASGGGSQLTEQATEWIEKYQKLHEAIQEYSNSVFDEEMSAILRESKRESKKDPE